MEANIYFFLTGDVGDASFGADVEAYNNNRRRNIVSLSCRGKQHIGLGNCADAGAYDANLDLFGRKFFERSLEYFDGALNVGF